MFVCDAALELDLHFVIADDDLLDQRPHDRVVICVHDAAVLQSVLEVVEDRL